MKRLAMLSLFGFLCLSANAADPVPATLADLKIFPSSIELNTKRDRQSVVVQATYSDGITRDATTQAAYTFAQPAIAKLDKSTVLPLADGATELKITFNNKTLVVPVKGHESGLRRLPISFKRDVMPVFMKGGCNAGSCHGAARGKDGFRLSLFGFDADNDYKPPHHRDDRAARHTSPFLRRASCSKRPPARCNTPAASGSRMIRKCIRPSFAGSKQVWPADGANVARCTNVEIEPRQMVLESGATHQVTVKASYSDGTHADVTSMALYLSNNDPSAKISQDGLVAADQRGGSVRQWRAIRLSRSAPR